MIGQKKGAEAIVVWVLLIGFVIALTTTVFIFEKKKATELGEMAVASGEAKLECSEVAVNNPACLTAPGFNCAINVVNTGRRSIDGFIFRDQKGNTAEFGSRITPGTPNFPMKPGVQLAPDPKGRANLDFTTSIEIIPLVNISNKLYACNEKILGITNICNC